MFDQGGAGGARFGRTALATGVAIGLRFVAAAHTAQTAGAEVVDVDLQTTGILQHATGALATQRTVRVQARTYSFVAASTITDAATLAIEGAPVAGTNATITNAYALWVQAGETRLDGSFQLGTDANLTIAAGNNNNQALPANATCLRIDAAAASILTGLTGGVDGRIVVLHNVDTADSWTITHDDAASTAANRFFLPGAVTLTVLIHGSVWLRYDATSSRWRVVS
jgi:hypothetical protein